MGTNKVDLKVVLLGKEYGGKTSLAERFLYTRFQENVPYQNTIGAAYGAKKIQLDGRSVSMAIWDTAGSERYRSMSRIYYRGAWAAIICYDVTDLESFARLQYWVDELKQHEEMCKIYLCGTKVDLIKDKRSDRMVDFHTVSDYADEIRGQMVETSSKTGENVAFLFNKIATDYLDEAPLREAKTKAQGIGLTDSSESLRNKRKTCCFR